MNVYINNFLKFKDLFLFLIIQEVKVKYRNSVLGIFWSMLNPLLMMVVFSIIFMGIFKNDIPNFPVYVLIGRVMYQFFHEATNFAMNSIDENAELINKVYVPKYFFPLTRIISTLIITSLSLIPIFIMMLVTGISFSWTNLFIFVPLLYLFFICTGLGLFLSAINVFFRDTQHFYSILTMILMYMTPIFYPASIIPEKYMGLVMLNPLLPVLNIMRDMLISQTISSWENHLISIVYSFIYCIIGFAFFIKTKDKFIYHL